MVPQLVWKAPRQKNQLDGTIWFSIFVHQVFRLVSLPVFRFRLQPTLSPKPWKRWSYFPASRKHRQPKAMRTLIGSTFSTDWRQCSTCCAKKKKGWIQE
jgi:hypothetical protein